MRLKKGFTAAVAVALTASPVMAQTGSAAPAAPARAAASTEGASELRGGFIIPLVAVVAIILGILAATGGSDRPHSP